MYAIHPHSAQVKTALGRELEELMVFYCSEFYKGSKGNYAYV
jgi:hypothetical protein